MQTGLQKLAAYTLTFPDFPSRDKVQAKMDELLGKDNFKQSRNICPSCDRPLGANDPRIEAIRQAVAKHEIMRMHQPILEELREILSRPQEPNPVEHL